MRKATGDWFSAAGTVSGRPLRKLTALEVNSEVFAQELARETAAGEMKKLTAGMNLPPGFGF